MNVRDLIPWRRNTSPAPTVYHDDPLTALRREMDRLFEDVFRGFDAPFPSSGSLSAWNGGWPNVEIADTGKEIRVTAEIPGLEEKDVEVLLDDDMLTLRGEKRAESEDRDRQFSERFYGRFERRIPLGSEIDEDKIDASFRNGVLTVTLPKTEQAQARIRRIAVNGRH